jgi:hypothetical protein
MHVLHRPHLPRLVGVSIAAAIIALASRLSNINEPSDNTSTLAHHAAPARTGALHTTPRGWASNPFASLLSRPLPQPLLTARR